jgi:hypothetical protein
VEPGSSSCSYELVRDGVVVATGQLTLPKVPVVADLLCMGGVTVEVTEALRGPRLRLVE